MTYINGERVCADVGPLGPDWPCDGRYGHAGDHEAWTDNANFVGTWNTETWRVNGEKPPGLSYDRVSPGTYQPGGRMTELEDDDPLILIAEHDYAMWRLKEIHAIVANRSGLDYQIDIATGRESALAAEAEELMKRVDEIRATLEHE